MNATPWSLDEFVAHDVFFTSAPDVDAPEHAPAVDAGAIEAQYEHRLAAEVARVEADAYARGRADGEQAARVTLEQALESALSTLSRAAESVALHEARWVNNIEENIAAIAVAVAHHLVQREITADPTFVATLVNKALAQYPVEQEIIIRVSPEDLATCRSVIDADLGGARALRWIGDSNVERGGCLTEGRERIIDGRVDTALERAYRTIAQIQA
ncbi:FliH/SctL family protein [Gemmatimonas sp.]|jgi:flagellar assembly protein FliH|uniref:FliH/SctL family protein n=1 Tax=Gemmatimonas sp. TaxID=1962908 RepID=UPI0037C0388B